MSEEAAYEDWDADGDGETLMPAWLGEAEHDAGVAGALADAGDAAGAHFLSPEMAELAEMLCRIRTCAMCGASYRERDNFLLDCPVRMHTPLCNPEAVLTRTLRGCVRCSHSEDTTPWYAKRDDVRFFTMPVELMGLISRVDDACWVPSYEVAEAFLKTFRGRVYAMRLARYDWGVIETLVTTNVLRPGGPSASDLSEGPMRVRIASPSYRAAPEPLFSVCVYDQDGTEEDDDFAEWMRGVAPRANWVALNGTRLPLGCRQLPLDVVRSQGIDPTLLDSWHYDETRLVLGPTSDPGRG